MFNSFAIHNVVLLPVVWHAGVQGSQRRLQVSKFDRDFDTRSIPGNTSIIAQPRKASRRFSNLSFKQHAVPQDQSKYLTAHIHCYSLQLAGGTFHTAFGASSAAAAQSFCLRSGAPL